MFMCDERLQKLQTLPRGEIFFLGQKPTRITKGMIYVSIRLLRNLIFVRL